MNNIKSAKKTLLLSIIMSSPGPLVVGLGLLAGQSSTQIADFVRRSIELLAIILSYIVFCITVKNDSVDEVKKKKYEKCANLFVSIAMILSGIIMTALALSAPADEKGNVIPGLVIALSGIGANCVFWIKYKRLGQKTNNKLLLTQSKLYRGKVLVDSSVVVALTIVLISHNQHIAHWFDVVGTICVSVYLAFTGTTSFIKEMRN